MYDRYTPTARQVMSLAKVEAIQAGSPAIEVEHILLALADEDRDLVSRVRLTRGDVEEALRNIGGASGISPMALPMSIAALAVISRTEQQTPKERKIGTEDLLESILWAAEQNPRFVIARVFQTLGLQLNEMHNRISHAEVSRKETKASYREPFFIPPPGTV